MVAYAGPITYLMNTFALHNNLNSGFHSNADYIFMTFVGFLLHGQANQLRVYAYLKVISQPSV